MAGVALNAALDLVAEGEDLIKPAVGTQIIGDIMQHLDDESQTNWETYNCPAHEEISILSSGAMKISCKDNPIMVQARICPPQVFDKIVDKMEEMDLVS